MKANILGLVAAGLLAGPIAADAVTLTSLGGNQYSAEFDSITFQVTTAGAVGAIVFEDFFTIDSSASCGTYVSGTVQTSVNGGPTANLIGNTCTGLYDSLNDADGNDLLVTIFGGFSDNFGSVSVGDFVTVSSLNYVFQVFSLDPSANSGPFAAFLVNNSFQRISALSSTAVPVPEPGTLALLGLGLAALGLSRRRKAD